jgi:hypothetical protein
VAAEKAEVAEPDRNKFMYEVTTQIAEVENGKWSNQLLGEVLANQIW